MCRGQKPDVAFVSILQTYSQRGDRTVWDNYNCRRQIASELT